MIIEYEGEPKDLDLIIDVEEKDEQVIDYYTALMNPAFDEMSEYSQAALFKRIRELDILRRRRMQGKEDYL